MNNMPIKGTMSQSGGILRLDNALVEEVNVNNRGTGDLIVSYGVTAKNNTTKSEQLRINVSRRTRIRNQFGEALILKDIRKGTRINAACSAAVTKSIPPQTTAFEIVALTEPSSVKVTTGRVVSVDVANGFLITGTAGDIYNQMKFVVNRATVITDVGGKRISLKDIRPGQTVRVEHASFQTASIPPQTTAFKIAVIRNA